MNRLSKILNSSGLEYGFCSFKDYLYECRAKNRLPKNSKSIIVFLFPYYSSELSGGNISIYAASKDYHNVAKKYLQPLCSELLSEFPQNSFKWFCDNSPIFEVDAGARAGLGYVGENGLLINDSMGSYFFIGEIVTDMELDVTDSAITYCNNCGLCEQACPVGLDKSICLSHITQKKGELSSSEQALLKKHPLIWGCDTCQLVCPHNKGINFPPLKDFKEDIVNTVTLENYEKLTPGRAFAFRGLKVIKET